LRKSFLDVGRVNSERLFARRFILLLTALSILSLLLITRLYYLQVISYEHFDTLSKTNHIKYIPTPPRRGIIYDRNNIVLADNLPLYSIEINLNEAKDIEKILDSVKKKFH